VLEGRAVETADVTRVRLEVIRGRMKRAREGMPQP
jgi:hypothetical protein